MIDLHTHSHHSDGVDSVASLVEKASDAGLKALALTDHDTFAGNTEAEELCRRNGIKFLPGIELDLEWGAGEFHLLGLNCRNTEDSRIYKYIRDVQSWKKERNKKIIARLRKIGLRVSYEELLERAGSAVIGRPHIAGLLVEKKFAVSINDAFNRYLTTGKPGYLDRQKISIFEGIDLIHTAGGKAIVAHPSSLYISRGRWHEYLKEWIDTGLDGLEVSHPAVSESESRFFEGLCQKNHLLRSGGSDYHGRKEISNLGFGTAGWPVSEEFLKGILY